MLFYMSAQGWGIGSERASEGCGTAEVGQELCHSSVTSPMNHQNVSAAGPTKENNEKARRIMGKVSRGKLLANHGLQFPLQL